MMYKETYLKILKGKGACPGTYRGAGEITCSERCGTDLESFCCTKNNYSDTETHIERRYKFVCNKLIEEGYEAEVFEEML